MRRRGKSVTVDATAQFVVVAVRCPWTLVTSISTTQALLPPRARAYFTMRRGAGAARRSRECTTPACKPRRHPGRALRLLHGRDRRHDLKECLPPPPRPLLRRTRLHSKKKNVFHVLGPILKMGHHIGNPLEIALWV